MIDEEPEPEPTYWWCNSCGDEVDDEAAECCDDGENEASYDEAAAPPTTHRPNQGGNQTTEPK